MQGRWFSCGVIDTDYDIIKSNETILYKGDQADIVNEYGEIKIQECEKSLCNHPNSGQWIRTSAMLPMMLVALIMIL